MKKTALYFSVVKNLRKRGFIKNVQKASYVFPIIFQAILWQYLPIAQLLAVPTASLLDHDLYVPCITKLRCKN